MKLAGKKAVITGASQGFGLAVAECYVREGASVMICARDAVKIEEAVRHLKKMAGDGQRVLGMATDVSRRDEVTRLLSASVDSLGSIDILVNNAGVYGPKGSIIDIDVSEWIQAMEINLYSILFLCQGVIPLMKEQGYGKIINLSGGGATAPLPGISAYAASKAAVVRLTETLAEEWRDDHIDINAVAPGALNTRLLDEVLAAGPEKVGGKFYDKALKQRDSGGTPLTRGAELCVFLGSAESDGITGKLISAVWDPWENLQQHVDILAQSDIYTLRRIIPADRDADWGER